MYAMLRICLPSHLVVVVLVEYLLLGLAEEVLEVLDEGGVLLVVRLLEVHLQQDNLILAHLQICRLHGPEIN